MLEALIPKEKVFFELFAKAASKGVEACTALEVMLNDLGHAEGHSRRIKELEHEGDELTHRTVELLHKTFVTPLDRDDIHRLITRLDDVLDLTEAASARLQMYDVKVATPESIQQVKVLIRSAQQLEKALNLLSTAKKSQQQILDICVEVNRLENEGDAIMRGAIARLFREEQDIRSVLKWKEIYDDLETAIDRCEDVANIVEGIVIEMA
jgi:predicted phosphate transport protein (TIGR00153 family)